MPNPTARHIECTNEEYQARGEFSRSQHTLVRDNPALFHGRFVAHTDPQKKKKVWDTGTVAHACLLEPDNIDNAVAIIPVDDFRTTKGDMPSKPLATADCKAWRAEHPGIIHQTAEEFAAVQRMIDNVHGHPMAEVLYEHAIHFEYTIVWECEHTGLPLRVRPDMICRLPDGVTIPCRQEPGMVWTLAPGLYVPDFKTARGITKREFRNAAAEYAYYRQADMYTEGVEALFGEPVVKFPFVCSEKTPAYQCEVYTLSPEFLALGHDENREIRLDFLRRTEEGDWHSESWGEAREVDLPMYKYRE